MSTSERSPTSLERTYHTLTYGLKRIGFAIFTIFMLASALNALCIGGGIIGGLVGVHLGQAVEAHFLNANAPSLLATAAFWTTTILFWAITTIPGFFVLEPSLARHLD